MNRLIAAALFIAAATLLAACGDAGDHLGEFKQTGGSGGTGSTGTTPAPSSGPAAVSAIVLSLVGPSPNPNQAGTYPLNITIFGANGQPVPANTLLSSEIVVTSNASCALGFAEPATPSNPTPPTTFYSSVSTNFAPGSGIVMGYSPGTGCSDQNVTITVNLQSQAVAAGTLSLFGGQGTVTQLQLQMISAPNPASAGVYPFFVTMTGTVGGGAPGVLPAGLSLANPVTLTSDNTCVVAFGTSPAIANGTGTQFLPISSTSTLAYLYFNPGNATISCPSTATATVTASAPGVAPVFYSFTNDLPVASVGRKIAQ